jgi:pimeloyl-ACP methyl ester carboxylesterase
MPPSHPDRKTLALVHRDAHFSLEYFLRPGEGETIVFLHGLGCSKADYEDAAAASELAGFTVLSFDFPGSGNSSYRRELELGIADLVEITRKVFAALEVPPCLLVGHSMGGVVALLYARKYQGELRGICNVEGNLGPEDCFISRRVAAHPRTGFSQQAFAGLVDEFDRSSDRGMIRYAESLRTGVCREAYYDYSSSLVRCCEEGDLLDHYRRLDIPKYFLYGSRSAPPRSLSALQDRGGEVIEIPGSGHFPAYENPLRFYQLIATLVHGLAGRPAEYPSSSH